MTGFFLFLSCATQGGKFCRIKRGKPEVAGSCRDAESKTPAKVKPRRVGVAGQHALTRLIEAQHALTRLNTPSAFYGQGVKAANIHRVCDGLCRHMLRVKLL